MALSTDRRTPKRGQNVIADYVDAPVAASTVIYNGALVALNASGYAVPADSTTAGLRVVGVASAKADNSAGANGAIKVRVERGVFGFKNSASTSAVSAADAGRPCYAVDDCTVARIPSMGARPFAGRVYDVDAVDGLVYVEIGGSQENDAHDLLLLAGADLSSSQHLFVELGSGGTVTVCNAAGETALGVLQNAPANGAVAIVRIRGRSRVIASGSITTGAHLATTSAGKSKAAVAASVKTDDAGAAADAVSGSFVMGTALTDGTTDAAHFMLIEKMGAIPTAAA